jgi:excisionase family DNA binding protein
VALEKLLSIEEVAELLGVPKRSMYRWRTTGEGPKGVRVGRHLRYRPESVSTWLEQREHQGSGPGIQRP